MNVYRRDIYDAENTKMLRGLRVIAKIFVVFVPQDLTDERRSCGRDVNDSKTKWRRRQNTGE